MAPRDKGNKFKINVQLLYAQAWKFAIMLWKETFKASNYWLMHFRCRHGITFQKVNREKKFAPINEANEQQ